MRTSERRSERLSNGLISHLNGVHVDAKCHRRVRVAQSTGDGPNMMTARDGGRRGPMSKIVESPLRIDSRTLSRPTPPRAGSVRVGGTRVDREHTWADDTPFRPPLLNHPNGRLVERTARKLAVFVGGSINSGLPPLSGSRRTATLLSTVKRSSLSSSHRSAAISPRRAPVAAAICNARAAPGSMSNAA